LISLVLDLTKAKEKQELDFHALLTHLSVLDQLAEETCE